jgi:hypothetical protein
MALNLIIPPLDGEHPQCAGAAFPQRLSRFRRLPAGRLTVTLETPRRGVSTALRCIATRWNRRGDGGNGGTVPQWFPWNAHGSAWERRPAGASLRHCDALRRGGIGAAVALTKI